jgi:hypothetical protein
MATIEISAEAMRGVREVMKTRDGTVEEVAEYVIHRGVKAIAILDRFTAKKAAEKAQKPAKAPKQPKPKKEPPVKAKAEPKGNGATEGMTAAGGSRGAMMF